jgi:hypothetical protein
MVEARANGVERAAAPGLGNRSPMTIASSWQALTLGQEPLELAVVPRSEGLEDRSRALAISLLLQADRIRFGLLALARDVNPVDPCTEVARFYGTVWRLC